MLFIQRVINIEDQLRNDFVDAVIFVRGFFRRPGNNQRRARFVNQNRVHFVHNREVMPALHAILQIVLHVVAQIIEAELVVGAKSDVRAIRRPPLHVIQIVNDHAHGQPQHLVNRPHPFRVPPRQIIVHRHNVNALSRQRVQVRRQRRHQRLSFTRLHLRDFSLMQYDSADKLNVEMPHSQRPSPDLAHQRERRNYRRLNRLLQPPFVVRIIAFEPFQTALHLGLQRLSPRCNLRV